jgi:hypothetical protein
MCRALDEKRAENDGNRFTFHRNHPVFGKYAAFSVENATSSIGNAAFSAKAPRIP